MLHALVIGALLLYTASAVTLLLDVSAVRRGHRAGEWLLGGAFVLHTLLVLLVLVASDVELLPASRGDYYLWTSWGLPLVYFAFGKRMRYPIVAAFLVPLAILFLVSSSYLAHRPLPRSEAPGIFFQVFHLIPAIVSEVALVLAFIISCIYLIQQRRLKRKLLGAGLLQGPSLDLLDSLNRRFVLTGFLAMSIAILSGSLWAWMEGHGLLRADLFQWLGILVWLLLALIHHLRQNASRSARELATLTVCASGILFFALLLFLFVGGQFDHGSSYT